MMEEEQEEVNDEMVTEEREEFMELFSDSNKEPWCVCFIYFSLATEMDATMLAELTQAENNFTDDTQTKTTRSGKERLPGPVRKRGRPKGNR